MTMPTKDNANDAAGIEVIWRAWKDKSERRCGHRLELHLRTVPEAFGDVVAFVDGFGWLHGENRTVVYYLEPNPLTAQEFTELKLRVEEFIQKRQAPLWSGLVTERVFVKLNC